MRQGQYIKNSAIHDTYNRCVTVHGTNFLHVENNVTYNTVGHCFFLEDGAEHGNQFVHNLAIQIKCHTSKACVPTNLAANGENMGSNPLNRATYRAASMSGKDTLLPSDNTVTAYWITNPDNVFIDNVAAGSDENGFWWSLPEHPQGKFEGTEISKTTWPRRTRMAEFRGNVAHSNFDGFMLDRNINLEGVFGLAGPSHIAKENPADDNSKSVESLLAGSHRLQEPQWRRLEPRRAARLPESARRRTMPSGSRVQRVPSALTHLPHWWLIRCSWAKPTTSATP